MLVLVAMIALGFFLCFHCYQPVVAPKWRWGSLGIRSQATITDIAIAASDNQILYLATYVPGGLYRSDDAGRSWRSAGSALQDLS